VNAPNDWEPLWDALQRVIKAGMPEDVGKDKICRAITSGAISVRAIVIATELPGRVFGSGNVFVPDQLSPNLFDWEQSRPLEPWSIGPGLGDHHWRVRRKYWPIDVLEVSRPDVDAMLSGQPSPRGFCAAAFLQPKPEWKPVENQQHSALQATRGAPLPAREVKKQNRRASPQMIEKFAAEYKAREEAAGRPPTKAGVVRQWAEAGNTGHRDEVRDTLGRLMGGEVKRGRPQKSRLKIAEK
jgi:hypothetical protein